MSQDLFAAFVSPEPEHATRNLHQNSSENRWESSAEPGNRDETPLHVIAKGQQGIQPSIFDEDDDFGDFEDASATSIPQQSVTSPITSTIAAKDAYPLPRNTGSTEASEPKDPRIGKHPFAAHMDLLFSADDEEYDAGVDDLEDLSRNPEAAMAYSKRIIADQLERQSAGGQQPASGIHSSLSNDTKASGAAHTPSPLHSHKRPPRDPNVLFDADDVSEESEQDDFGDFEDAPASSISVSGISKVNHSQHQTTLPNIDLLGLNDDPVLPSSSNTYSADRSRQPLPNTSSGRPDSSRIVSSPSKQGTYNEDEAWDDFDEAEPAHQSSTAAATIVAATPKAKKAVQTGARQDGSPPTNVPPPVILLSIFPSIFATAREVLLDPLSRLEPAERQHLLAHPATIQFLQKYLSTATVLGHIIAGRKSRWKRDQYLAQSMRIGPASAGGKGGMKLAGLDKTEAAKEEREVLDMVRLWKGQVGKLRGAVASASSSRTAAVQKLPPVPEITDPIPVQTLKAVQGGFTAPHACALCGLKREERVAKIDVEINDSFGEWWLDGMSMHLVCHDFWAEYKDKLKSR